MSKADESLIEKKTKKPSIADARADMAEPLPPRPPRKPRAKRRPRKGEAGEYLHLWGPSELFAYLVERHAITALPLLLAIYPKQDLQKEASVALTRTVWEAAGNPSTRLRRTMLTHLHRLPGLVVIREDRDSVFRYRVEKGPTWRAIERAAKPAKIDEEGT
jgi:hypothetical protein